MRGTIFAISIGPHCVSACRRMLVGGLTSLSYLFYTCGLGDCRLFCDVCLSSMLLVLRYSDNLFGRPGRAYSIRDVLWRWLNRLRCGCLRMVGRYGRRHHRTRTFIIGDMQRATITD